MIMLMLMLIPAIHTACASPAPSACPGLPSYFSNCKQWGGSASTCCDERYAEVMKDMCANPKISPCRNVTSTRASTDCAPPTGISHAMSQACKCGTRVGPCPTILLDRYCEPRCDANYFANIGALECTAKGLVPPAFTCQSCRNITSCSASALNDESTCISASRACDYDFKCLWHQHNKTDGKCEPCETGKPCISNSDCGNYEKYYCPTDCGTCQPHP